MFGRFVVFALGLVVFRKSLIFSFSMLVEFEELYDAYIDCRRHKRSSSNCQDFEIDATRKLWNLWKDLNSGKYEIGRSIAFIVHHPKDREVFAADFRDRIVHHLVIRRMADMLEKEFIEDSYSCRKGKGTLFGIKRCQMYIQKVSKNYTKKAYILKGDFKSFFMRIDKTKMYQSICRLLEEKSGYGEQDMTFMKRVIHQIVFNRPQNNSIRKQPKSAWNCLPADKSLYHCDDNHGLPIGNLTSQIFANLFLSDFDHWVKDTLGFKEYGRYVDDFFIVSADLKKLQMLIPRIKEFLQDYGVTLHPHKVSIQEAHCGLQFLGQAIKPYGRVVARKTVGQLYTKLNTFNDFIVWHKKRNLEIEKADVEYMVSSVNSYYGYMRQTKSARLRKKTAKVKLMKEVLEYAHFDNDYNKIIKNKDNDGKQQFIYEDKYSCRLRPLGRRRVQKHKATG